MAIKDSTIAREKWDREIAGGSYFMPSLSASFPIVQTGQSRGYGEPHEQRLEILSKARLNGNLSSFSNIWRGAGEIRLNWLNSRGHGFCTQGSSNDLLIMVTGNLPTHTIMCWAFCVSYLLTSLNCQTVLWGTYHCSHPLKKVRNWWKRRVKVQAQANQF